MATYSISNRDKKYEELYSVEIIKTEDEVTYELFLEEKTAKEIFDKMSLTKKKSEAVALNRVKVNIDTHGVNYLDYADMNNYYITYPIETLEVSK